MQITIFFSRVIALMLVALLLASCGADRAEAPRHGDFNGAVSGWEGAAGTSRAQSETVTATDADRGMTEQTLGRGHTRDDRRRPVTHIVDVRFDDADLVDALRFLAQEAGVSLVVGENVRGRVDDRLERVDAYRAMVAIARAHGATVERQGQVVIVRGQAHPPDRQ